MGCNNTSQILIGSLAGGIEQHICGPTRIFYALSVGFQVVESELPLGHYTNQRQYFAEYVPSIN